MKKSRSSLYLWLLRLFFGGLVLVLLVYFGSNLFLISGLGRGLIEKRLNQRTNGLSWHLEGASWSPWGGIVVNSISAEWESEEKNKEGVSDTMKQPPFIQVQEARAWLDWKRIREGRKALRSIELTRPELSLPLELLLPRESPPPTIQDPEIPLAQNEDQQSTADQAVGEKGASSSSEPEVAAEAAEVATETATTVHPPLVQTSSVESPAWLKVEKAQIRLFSATHPAEFEITDLDIDLPLAGPSAEGSLSWATISGFGKTIFEETSFPIRWEDFLWKLDPLELAVLLPQSGDDEPLRSLITQISGAFEPRNSQRPFAVNVSILQQPIPSLLVHEASRFHFKADAVAGQLIAGGQLLNPDSWQMEGGINVRGLECFSAFRQQHFLFEGALARANLSYGVFNIPTVTLRSDQFSLMGNGKAFLGGYAFGVMRIVADPTITDQMTRVAVGSHLSRWVPRWLQPLETPDRFYRDLHIEGPLSALQMNVNREDEYLPLVDAVALLEAFIQRESREENKAP